MFEAVHAPEVVPPAPAGASATARRLRPPPREIALLLPVWGEEFIEKFLDQSLPTLLAPGNIPALAKALPTRFVFLSRKRDEATVRSHPAFARLDRLVEVEFAPIDDLIGPGNHSTTITLAYARMVRQAGEAMLDTCFFFLVSDYIMADGSLASVLTRMLDGASAVQVGNFQLEADKAEPWLEEKLKRAGPYLALSPREVMRWGLGCLHPITAANIVNFELCHNSDANRLLWRVDDETLIGRFYLLHMICIRPETTDFVIGSSCDYSFVPEMCPSGNVTTITDSDDYLVVEMQHASHEQHFLRIGPVSPDALARHLSEWTTAGHRANAERSIVFHAGDPPPALPAALTEADDFIRTLAPRLSPRPQPHRDHPYWRGAMIAFARRNLEGDAALPPIERMVYFAYARLFGRAPDVRRAHPRWKDFRRPLAACRGLIADPSARLLIGANRPTPLTEWMRREAPDASFISPGRLLRKSARNTLEPDSFDGAFIELVDNDIVDVEEILQLVAKLMRPGAEIVVCAINARWYRDPDHFGRQFAASLGALARIGLWPLETYVTSTSRLRWWINRMTITAARSIVEKPKAFLPLHLTAAAALCPLMTGANLISARRRERPPRGRIASSVFVRLRVGRGRAWPEP